MKTLTLTEYQTSAVPRELLPETAGQMLYHRYEQQQRVLTIEFPGYKTGDQWQITPGGWVGYVPVGPELALYIQPKVSLDNLFRLLAYGHGLHRFLPGIVQTGSLPAFYSHLAAVLARGVLARGVLVGGLLMRGCGAGARCTDPGAGAARRSGLERNRGLAA